MKVETNCILNAIVIGVVLNLVLPVLLKPFATEEEKKPPNGAASLSPKGQFMHMMVHHNQVICIWVFLGLTIVAFQLLSSTCFLSFDYISCKKPPDYSMTFHHPLTLELHGQV